MTIVRFLSDIYIDFAFALAALAYIALHWNNDASHIAGTILATLSLLLWVKARLDLAEAFSVTPQARHLVTSGLYARIRHPIYVFSVLTLAGIVIALEKPALYLVLVAVAVLQTIRARKEDALLQREFGERYRAYAHNTWI